MKDRKKFYMDILPILIFLPAIVITGIVFQQRFIKLLPTIGTLFVIMFISKAYRIGFLFAAINSAIYGVGFIFDGLYGSLVSSMLISTPLSLISYFKWKKQPVGKTTVIKKASLKLILLSVIVCIAGWAGFYIVASQAPGANRLLWLDSAVVPMGLVVAVLQLFAYRESSHINFVSTILSVTIWSILVADNIANINYLLISSYNLYRVVLSIKEWSTLYKKQNAGVQISQPAATLIK